jgi:hypothetical protein
VQVTERVSEAVAEHVELGADQEPAVHEYVQVDVSLKVWVSAPSAPHVALVGVQDSDVAGAVPAPAQKLFATV